jgi:SMC interacting uncharacterized protein involved in chromosome segregation
LVVQLQRELEKKDEELAAAQRMIQDLQQQLAAARLGGLG